MKLDGTIRIEYVEIINFMNVQHGKIYFPHSLKNYKYKTESDIVGLYGQNGSGKTAFVHVLDIIKRCLSGSALSEDTAEYITYKKHFSEIHTAFKFIKDGEESYFYYDLILSIENNKTEGNKGELVYISSETLSYKGKTSRKRVLLQYDNDSVLKPKSMIDGLCESDSILKLNFINGSVQAQRKSFLFSQELSEFFAKSYHKDQISKNDNFKTMLYVIRELQVFAREYLYVIGMRDNGLINLSLIQPVYFHLIEQKSRTTSFGTLGFSLDRAALIPKDAVHTAEKLIDDMNIVLQYLVPDLRIILKNLGIELDEKGNSIARVELVSQRDGQEFPLRFESEGIKKIISILHVFIGAYNNPSMTIVIDELDAGIFEYLLGEMLSVFQESGKGQLIFTSHNLRPLEVLHRQSIVFTTTNPVNRYVRMSNIRPNNNLRDFYYRVIQLGGEKECLYEETNRYGLALALRKAGSHEET